MKLVYDSDVKGMVYMQSKWPKIRYFKDWGEYKIDGYRTAVIGGAYSVDKWYRLDKGYIWYPDEQLSEDEQSECFQYICGTTREKLDRPHYDLVLTHTCPIQYEPDDLFLNGIDQSKVDKSMEIFLQKIHDKIYFKVWLWGHYHADRIERPRMEMFYNDTESLNDIMYRWKRYSETKELDWWLNKSPNYYME